MDWNPTWGNCFELALEPEVWGSYMYTCTCIHSNSEAQFSNQQQRVSKMLCLHVIWTHWDTPNQHTPFSPRSKQLYIRLMARNVDKSESTTSMYTYCVHVFVFMSTAGGSIHFQESTLLKIKWAHCMQSPWGQLTKYVHTQTEVRYTEARYIWGTDYSWSLEELEVRDSPPWNRASL